ncbi:biotin-dependent carboxyltransferase family protein [Halalkalibacter alkaliphilus]|uniref:Biotin-dependent carboxyltransferase family protein n=1 Tax=Halalkalibacter alkaliphilus TaxID=2917993 RepID=A0A9X2CWR3_9BACI|nr:biotin-dependent carboxyltransferase family protein [Halalkalibacter alkaliphilus]MCL7749656.1 biotin-dependent carboxyltransferase family protein [Halalkalibacter alkaliphilus]
MALRVIKPGLLTTIQDLGRTGFQKHGVIMSGAMDPLSLRLANLLVGNEEGEAALEMTLAGPSLRFEADTIFAICGGDLSPTINQKPVPIHRPIYVKRDSVLSFGPAKAGCRGYLAVAGGFEIPKVMGSKSTYLRAGVGGYRGRALEAGDVITYQKQKNILPFFEETEHKNAPFCTTGWGIQSYLFHRPKQVVRIIPGPHFEQFTKESREDLFHCKFKVTPQSDRMGYRLSGQLLRLGEQMELLSEAVTLGTIQVPPDGNPIILLADRQTIGGYPKIGQVIDVDIPVIAQLKPGERISFKSVSIYEAERLLLKREMDLKELKAGILLKQMST